MSDLITTEVVRATLREEHYVLLTEYEGRREPFMCLCPQGHPWMTQWAYWKSGSRCPRCAVIRNHNMSRLAQEEVSNRLKQAGYELLSEYHSANVKIQYKCPAGHIGSMTLGNFQNGKRCPICSRIAGGEKRRRDYDGIRSTVLSLGYEPLFDEWHLGTEKVDFRCLECGKTVHVQLNSMLQGDGGCAFCKGKRIIKARYQNGTIPSSKQQTKLRDLFGGIINYPVKQSALDIAFPDEKIYVEYDGSGHRLSVLRGELSTQEFDAKQKRRTYGLMKDGWRCIRIISQRDYLPNDEVLLSLFRMAKEYLSKGHHYFNILIDENKVQTSEFESEYDFGELKQLPRSR